MVYVLCRYTSIQLSLEKQICDEVSVIKSFTTKVRSVSLTSLALSKKIKMLKIVWSKRNGFLKPGKYKRTPIHGSFCENSVYFCEYESVTDNYRTTSDYNFFRQLIMSHSITG